jgi:hypothetical protein
MIVSISRRSTSSSPCASTSSSLRAARATSTVMCPLARTSAKSRTRRSSRLATRGVPRDRSPPPAPLRIVHRHAEDARRAADDLLDVGGRVEIEAVDNAEPRAERRGEEPGPRRGAHERELLHRHLHRPRAGPLADDDVELEVLHRRIEDLLDGRGHAVDLVDEEHFAWLQVRQDAGQVARLLDDGTGRGADGRAQFVGNHVGQRGLAEPGRAVHQHVIERFAAPGAAAIDTCRFSRTRSCPM